MLSFEILAPGISDQERIAAVLSSLDAKIELNNRINAQLEAMAKTLYDYWFVQFDFPSSLAFDTPSGHSEDGDLQSLVAGQAAPSRGQIKPGLSDRAQRDFIEAQAGKPYKSSGGKMVYNAELKREIPEGWEVKSLSEITSVNNEQLNPLEMPDRNFRLYSIPTFDELGTFKIERGEDIKSNKFIIKETDLLVSKLNPWFSRVIYATADPDLISSTEFVVWRPKNIPLKNYLYMIARDQSFIGYCTKSATGTSNSHKRVNPDVMMRYRIVYNEEVAQAFGKILGPTIAMYAKHHQENHSLASLRDWLLPMLMNGQVTVG